MVKSGARLTICFESKLKPAKYDKRAWNMYWANPALWYLIVENVYTNERFIYCPGYRTNDGRGHKYSINYGNGYKYYMTKGNVRVVDDREVTIIQLRECNLTYKEVKHIIFNIPDNHWYDGNRYQYVDHFISVLYSLGYNYKYASSLFYDDEPTKIDKVVGNRRLGPICDILETIASVFILLCFMMYIAVVISN
jgi:hypothetical protein